MPGTHCGKGIISESIGKSNPHVSVPPITLLNLTQYTTCNLLHVCCVDAFTNSAAKINPP